MKYIKSYENINKPQIGNYIVYKTYNKTYNTYKYYILKIISIFNNDIILKPIWVYDLIKYINDDRGLIYWNLGIDLLSNDIIYFSNRLKDIRHFCNMLENINKYNL